MKKKLINYLRIFSLIIATVFTLSAFVDSPPPMPGGEDQTDDNEKKGSCYIVSTYECDKDIGGFGVTCSFTGIYGSPYSCSSVACGIFGGGVSTRKCVKKKVVAP